MKKRFKNIMEWVAFAVDASLAEIERTIPTDECLAFTENSTTFTLPEELVIALHKKLAGTEIEEKSWKFIISSFYKALPEAVAFDLVNRNIAVADLAHTHRTDAVLTRLAGFDEAALITLGRRHYTGKQYPVAAFHELLTAFGHSYQLLREMIYLVANEQDKRTLLLEFIHKHTQANDLLGQVNLLASEAKAAVTQVTSAPLRGEITAKIQT